MLTCFINRARYVSRHSSHL